MLECATRGFSPHPKIVILRQRSHSLVKEE
jgi:hypothetical protein